MTTSIPERINRKREKQAWQRDQEAGHAETPRGWGLFIDGDYDEPYIHFGEWASNPHRNPWAGVEN